MRELETLYSCFLRSSGICTDTRTLGKGQIFWALKGPSFNGNHFAAKALEDGAAFVVVDEPPSWKDTRVVVVEDSLTALQKLANHHRIIWAKPVVAVCGSNGKTTTKELIARALGAEKTVFSTPGNFNNHIGVPLSLLMLKAEHEIAVIEMGANHPGEIADLCQIAAPDSGLITNIGKDHLEGFGSLEGSAQANAELFDYLNMNNGTAFINSTDEWNQKLRGRVRNEFTFPQAKDDAPCGQVRSDFYLNIQIPGYEAVATHLTGQYNFNNLACALAVARFYGIAAKKALDAVAAYEPTNNRSQIIKSERNTIISDAYNANPSSMVAALENLLSVRADKKMAILGDMLELGADSAKEHFDLGSWCAQHTEIEYFITGTEMAAFARANPTAHYFPKKQALLEELEASTMVDCVILLKGSRGMKLETLLPHL